MSEECGCCSKKTCCYGSIGGSVLLLIIFLIASVSVIQFNEYAFLKAWGQSIDQSEVYTQGRYFVGFWNEFVTFPATVIDLQLSRLEVFSSSEGDDAGTTLDIDVGIQYVLEPARLSELFDIGGQNGFERQIQAESIETIKNVAPLFSADFYLTNRREIEAEFTVKLKERIAKNFAGTKVINVQLLRVPFPSSFYQRKLDVGLQGIRNEIENFTRETVNVRDETARKVLVIENDARRIVETARADAALIVAKAENDFDRAIGLAQEQAMNDLANSLDIVDRADFLSLNYLIQLLNNQKTTRKFVNFNNLPRATSLV